MQDSRLQSSLLKERGAIITGGASGIGAATARRFVQEGARVVIADLNDELGQALVQELGADKVHYIATDVAQAEQVGRLIKDGSTWLSQQGCQLDILFNNAGIGSRGKSPELSIEEWQRVIAIDLDSIFYGCHYAIPIMREQGGGVIVNNASMSGMRGDYHFSAYSAAKGGAINYTRTLALDHGRDNIRVNALCPGATMTPLIEGMKDKFPDYVDEFTRGIPLGRFASADEMANVALFLASDQSSYITGTTIVADGGRIAGTGQPDIEEWLQRRELESKD